MTHPKFILAMDGRIRLGMVVRHVELMRRSDECIGGGYYEVDYASNRLLLSGISTDFGIPRWHLVDAIALPKAYRGMSVVYRYDDPHEEDVAVTADFPITYY